MKLNTYIILIFTILFCTANFAQDHNNPCKFDIPETICMDCKNGNDYIFAISSNCQIKEFKLTVFNRWGQELFKTKSMTDFWDASKVKPGTFYWIIEGKYFNNKEIDLNGHVTRF